MCIEIYRNCILKNSELNARLLQTLILFIEKNRTSVDKPELYNDEIKKTVSSLFDMSLYKKLFEQKFLETSRIHYHKQTYEKFSKDYDLSHPPTDKSEEDGDGENCRQTQMIC